MCLNIVCNPIVCEPSNCFDAQQDQNQVLGKTCIEAAYIKILIYIFTKILNEILL